MTAVRTKRPPVARTTEGQPSVLGENGPLAVAHRDFAGKGRPRSDASVAYRAHNGATWHYRGKRGRVLAMLATMPEGVTQWDTLPWHTRLGASIHGMRRDGLLIDTEREGDFRHARYRLATPGSLVKLGDEE